MSLDERLRTELRSIETGTLLEDDALDSVLRKHDRGLALGRVTRQALAVAVVVSLFASVAMVVSWRNGPEHAGAASASDRYRSTATIRLATTSGVKELAMTPHLRKLALHAGHLSTDFSRYDFRATLDPARRVLSLTATAATRYESEIVSQRWAAVLIETLRAEAGRAHNRRVDLLLQQLARVNAELVRIDPATYKGYDLSYHQGRPFTDGKPRGEGPEHGSTHELNLANERVQIFASLADLGPEGSGVRHGVLLPPYVLAQTPAVRVHTSTQPRTTPVLVSWALGLVVVLGGALFVFRRRTRSARQVAA